MALGALGLVMTACDQKAPAPVETPVEIVNAEEDAAPALENSDIVPAPSSPVTVPPSTETTIQRIEGLMVSRPNGDQGEILIRASGLVNSRGWTNPRLVPTETSATRDVLSLSFVATSPRRGGPAADPQPIEALVDFPGLAPGIEIIRIVGATNELTAPANKSR